MSHIAVAGAAGSAQPQRSQEVNIVAAVMTREVMKKICSAKCWLRPVKIEASTKHRGLWSSALQYYHGKVLSDGAVGGPRA
jgi:hypothetical protein